LSALTDNCDKSSATAVSTDIHHLAPKDVSPVSESSDPATMNDHKTFQDPNSTVNATLEQQLIIPLSQNGSKHNQTKLSTITQPTTTHTSSEFTIDPDSCENMNHIDIQKTPQIAGTSANLGEKLQTHHS